MKVFWSKEEKDLLRKELLNLAQTNPDSLFNLLVKSQNVLPEDRRRKLPNISNILEIIEPLLLLTSTTNSELIIALMPTEKLVDELNKRSDYEAPSIPVIETEIPNEPIFSKFDSYGFRIS